MVNRIRWLLNVGLGKGDVTLVNLQRRFATHVFCTNLQTCYTFESLSKTSNALQHCKYRKKSFATGRYTRMIFRATSYHCKLALQVDQCNITLRIEEEGKGGFFQMKQKWGRAPDVTNTYHPQLATSV